MDGLIALFLLPVFAGYLVLTRTRLYSVRTNTYSMPRLFAECLVFGMGLLYLSSMMLWLYGCRKHFPELGPSVPAFIWEGIVWPVRNEVSNATGAKRITDQAVLSVILALIYIGIENCLTPKLLDKLRNDPVSRLLGRLYHRHDLQILAQRDKVGGSIERLFALSMNNFTPLQITMKSRKVYVAVIKDLPTLSPVIKQQRFVNILPFQSGYRHTDNLTVDLKVTDYSMIFDLLLMRSGVSPRSKTYAQRLQKILDNGDDTILENLQTGIAIDSDEIVSVSLWDQSIFDEFKQAEKKAKAKARPRRP